MTRKRLKQIAMLIRMVFGLDTKAETLRKIEELGDW
jgi:hypothetical protein